MFYMYIFSCKIKYEHKYEIIWIHTFVYVLLCHFNLILVYVFLKLFINLLFFKNVLADFKYFPFLLISNKRFYFIIGLNWISMCCCD